MSIKEFNNRIPFSNVMSLKDLGLKSSDPENDEHRFFHVVEFHEPNSSKVSREGASRMIRNFPSFPLSGSIDQRNHRHGNYNSYNGHGGICPWSHPWNR